MLGEVWPACFPRAPLLLYTFYRADLLRITFFKAPLILIASLMSQLWEQSQEQSAGERLCCTPTFKVFFVCWEGELGSLFGMLWAFACVLAQASAKRFLTAA